VHVDGVGSPGALHDVIPDAQHRPPVQSAPGHVKVQLLAQHATYAFTAFAPVPVIVPALPVSCTVPPHALAFKQWTVQLDAPPHVMFEHAPAFEHVTSHGTPGGHTIPVHVTGWAQLRVHVP